MQPDTLIDVFNKTSTRFEGCHSSQWLVHLDVHAKQLAAILIKPDTVTYLKKTERVSELKKSWCSAFKQLALEVGTVTLK